MTAKIEGMGEHFERFSSFIDEYLVILKGATKKDYVTLITIN